MGLRPITALSLFIQEMSIALDNGQHLSVQQVEEHIEGGDLIPWLKTALSATARVNLENCGQDGEPEWLVEQYAAVLGGYQGDEGRKWGIEHNGLCLLVSWGVEILARLPGVPR